MMRKRIISSHLLILILMASSVIAGSPAERGKFIPCQYNSKENLLTPEYLDAAIYYPCDTQKGPFAATTLTGGWSNVWADMEWISRHLATHGYVVIAMTPINNLGKNPEWRRAHNAGIAKLRSENQRKESPILGIVKLNSLQLLGFSKGGGGALMAGSDQGKKIKSILALAPYADGDYDFGGINAATLLVTSNADGLAPAGKIHAMFRSLPSNIDRTLASIRGFKHLEWLATGLADYHTKALTLIVAWMKVYLDGDLKYKVYLNGRKQDGYDEFVQIVAKDQNKFRK